MKHYYEFLKEELNNFEGNFDRYILYIPEFFKLLCNLTEEDEITLDDKRLINSALAYFVIPNDVIPEDIYGPAGYLDDVYVCAFVLTRLKEKYGIKLLEKHWEGEETFKKVLNVSFKKSQKELKDKGLLNRVLKFACLSDNNG